MIGNIFISYRRDDAAGYARAIYDALSGVFGADRVFMDVDDIQAGQPFGDVIDSAVGASSVMLVLIGRRWIGAVDGVPSRLAEPNDFVRREVSAALTAGVQVIPLLLDGASMPAPAQLPDELRALAGRNALGVDNTSFAADLDRLVSVLRPRLQPPPPGAAPGRQPPRWLWLAALLVAGAATLGFLQWRAPAPETPTTPTVDGAWIAEVTYDWPNSRRTERFVFASDGTVLRGSAGFLGVARGVLEGRVEPPTLTFVTRTQETAGAATVDVVHRYRGSIDGHDIRFVMQTEGGSTPHVPIEFVARREALASR